MIRLAVSAAAAALLLASTAHAAEGCLTYGEPTTILSGVVYAMEAFDEAETDTVARERQIDFYALVMPDRVCLAGADGDARQPPLQHVSIVRLDMPTEMAKMVVQKRVAVQGPLSANAAPDADPPVVMTVKALRAAAD